MEKLSASQQQRIKKMAEERLRTKLVAAGYEDELVWSWELRWAHLQVCRSVVGGAKPKVAPAPADPALEMKCLAFDMKRWEAEQEERKLQKEEEMRK